MLKDINLKKENLDKEINKETRKSQILENIEAAEKHRKESEQKIKDYEKIINEAKIEAKNIFNQAREKILKGVNTKKKNLEKQINEEIKKAEDEILKLKKKSPEKINKIAIETSADLIKQIIGVEVNNSNISAIVEDISKRNEEKYYGN
jgi:F-type H+-transporting ATPase subunit b